MRVEKQSGFLRMVRTSPAFSALLELETEVPATKPSDERDDRRVYVTEFPGLKLVFEHFARAGFGD